MKDYSHQYLAIYDMLQRLELRFIGAHGPMVGVEETRIMRVIALMSVKATYQTFAFSDQSVHVYYCRVPLRYACRIRRSNFAPIEPDALASKLTHQGTPYGEIKSCQSLRSMGASICGGFRYRIRAFIYVIAVVTAFSFCTYFYLQSIGKIKYFTFETGKFDNKITRKNDVLVGGGPKSDTYVVNPAPVVAAGLSNADRAFILVPLAREGRRRGERRRAVAGQRIDKLRKKRSQVVPSLRNLDNEMTSAIKMDEFTAAAAPRAITADSNGSAKSLGGDVVIDHSVSSGHVMSDGWMKYIEHRRLTDISQ